MLIVEQKACHLYREDAYREYCWSVDAYGAYQPASFIYLCFESFKDACAEFGLELVYRTSRATRERFPWRYERDSIPENELPRGLILRIESDEDVAAATQALREGRNVIALIPTALLSIYYPWDDERLARSKASIAHLGINPSDWQFHSIGMRGQGVRWVEIDTDTPGRLFTTCDYFLSDGYFMEGYGYSEENRTHINTLIQSFACFKYNLLRLSHRNTISSWPTGEPLTLLIDVWNHGPDLNEAMLMLNISQELEPLSPLERRIPHLRSLEHTSFAFQGVPRVDGDIPLIVGATASLPNGRGCEVVVAPLALRVLPAIGSAQRASVPEDNPTLQRILAVFRDANMPSEVEALPELARVDARACLNRLRVLTERIVFQLLERHGISCHERSLAAGITALRDRRIVSQRAVSYLHTIRVIGNIASHASSEPLGEADIRIVSYALACVVEELMDKNLL